MAENKTKGTNWQAIIIGIVIYILAMMWNSQRQENEKAKEVFAQQTARAQNQEEMSISATREVEDKIDGCLKAYEVQNYSLTNQCVYGVLGLVEESTQSKVDPNEPYFYRSYFNYMPTGFRLYGDIFLGAYVNDCVMVWGDIIMGLDGTPSLLVTNSKYGLNIETLPDSVCRQ